MTHPVGTEVGVPRQDLAKLEILGIGVTKAQEGLGELREDYLDVEQAFVSEEPDGWESALGNLRRNYLLKESAHLLELRKARSTYVVAVREAASKLGLNLGDDSNEEWEFFPDRGVFERTA